MELAMNRNWERRGADRQPPDTGVGALTLTLRTGATVEVIDISAGGALVETSVRLEPGTNLAIRAFATRTGVVRRAVVIHCRVWSLYIRSGIRFRAGLRFELCSCFPVKGLTHVSGNKVPTHSRCQPEPWGAAGRNNRDRRDGAQVAYGSPR
jgi:hypothetical protein